MYDSFPPNDCWSSQAGCHSTIEWHLGEAERTRRPTGYRDGLGLGLEIPQLALAFSTSDLGPPARDLMGNDFVANVLTLFSLCGER